MKSKRNPTNLRPLNHVSAKEYIFYCISYRIFFAWRRICLLSHSLKPISFALQFIIDRLDDAKALYIYLIGFATYSLKALRAVWKTVAGGGVTYVNSSSATVPHDHRLIDSFYQNNSIMQRKSHYIVYNTFLWKLFNFSGVDDLTWPDLRCLSLSLSFSVGLFMLA